MGLRDMILVVDDDVMLLQLMLDTLSAAGYKVTSAEEASQALIQATALRPKLIITDVQMPIWGTGFDAYQKIRETPELKDVAIIFVTGMNPEEAKKQCPKDPKVRLLSKPLDWALLEQSIQELIGEEKPLKG